MDRKVDLKNHFDSRKTELCYEDETTCPVCKAKIMPVYIMASLNTDTTASVFNYCQNCRETFITQYKIVLDDSNKKFGAARVATVVKRLYSEPNRFEKKSFDDRLEILSPQFVKIYNQALAAECAGLDEIAGLGFRKALEFLVKDFAIHTQPDDEEKIKTMMLAPCIKTYIENKRIVNLAEKSAWIGNDEAHYVRKQKNLDVSNMKEFIQALVYFVSMDLVAEEASAVMANKK